MPVGDHRPNDTTDVHRYHPRTNKDAADEDFSGRRSTTSSSRTSSSASDEADFDATAALLQGRNNNNKSNVPDSIPLKMFSAPSLKRSASSKRIIYRDSDDEDEADEQPQQQQGQASSSGQAGAATLGHGRLPSSSSRPGSQRRSTTLSRAASYRAASMRRHSRADGDAGEDGFSDEPVWSSIFDDRRTAKENKSLAVSAELDAMGMGRYQWCIFVLCCCGFFIDLLWAQIYGLITVPLRNEGFGANDNNIGTVSVAFNVGLTVGAFAWGIGVDVLGRKWAFYLTCLTSGIFGLASGSPSTFTGVRVLVAFAGFGVGGNIPIDTSITLECLPTNRHYLLALLSIGQPFGTLVASGIAYGFIPRYSCGGGQAALDQGQQAACTRDENAGWRYAIYVIGCITLFIFFLRFAVFKFYESPAYLINRGHDQEALDVLYSIAKFNRMEQPRLTRADFDGIEQRCREQASIGSSTLAPDDSADGSVDKGKASAAAADQRVTAAQNEVVDIPVDEKAQQETRKQTLSRTLREMGHQFKGVRVLFRDRKMARITILLWITFMADFFGFNIAGVFLPIILADRGQAAGRPLEETYRDYVAIYAPGIAACLVACALIEVPRVGRQWVMVLSSALMAVSMFLYTQVDSQAGSVGLNTMEYFFQSLFNAVLYAVVPEYFPSATRGTAAGLTSTFGRIAGIIAPIAGQTLYSESGGSNQGQGATNTLYLGGSMTLLCPIALALLPFDTRGRRSY